MLDETTAPHTEENCKDLLEWLSDYIDGDLKGDLYTRIKAHEAACKPCAAFIATLQKTSELLLNKPGINVPPEDMDDLATALQQCKSDLKNPKS